MELAETFIIGMAGGSGSGKTSILKALVSKLPNQKVAVISQDNYYFPRDAQLADEKGEINFDLPTAIDIQNLEEDLAELVSGRAISRKEYGFNNAAAPVQDIHIEPAPIIIIEGLFIYYFETLARHFDIKVYIDAEDDTMLDRRIKRDLRERGYPESDVRYRWEHHVRPCYEVYLLPYRENCDLIIDNNESYEAGVAELIALVGEGSRVESR